MPQELLVFSERTEVLYELLSPGRRLADDNGWIVTAFHARQNTVRGEELIARGVDRVYQSQSRLRTDELQPIHFAEILKQITGSRDIAMILIGATKDGNELAARLAQKLGVGCATGCFDLQTEDGKVFAWRPFYGGKFAAKVAINKSPAVLTIVPKRFDPSAPIPGRQGQILDFQFFLPQSQLKVVEVKTKSKGAAELDKAEIIVSGGRGFKKIEDLKLLEELAQVIGGVVAGTRPLTEDMGWLPSDSQVGLSGKKVKPKLYLACGVSGQIQHIIGMRDSKVVVSVNLDPNAPIFQESDYYIVGDLYRVLPALIKAFKEALRK